jgi:pyruvate dehydrogenase phosphatase
MNGSERLKAIQLTDSHTVDNEDERTQLLASHPDDPKTIVSGRVKGKLKVTRAFGVGYLKKVSISLKFYPISLQMILDTDFLQ